MANWYLHQFDRWWWQTYGALSSRQKTKRRQSGLANSRLVRFADDWLLLTNGSRRQAEDLRDEAQQFLWDQLGLELNLDKTSITHAQDGFEFVGFHLQWLTPANRKPWLRAIPTSDNINRFKVKIRQMTHGQQIADPYSKIIALNRVLQGWMQYYRHANAKDIAHKLDWWVYRRVTQWLKRHHKWGVRRVLAQYEHQQDGRRKNLAVCNEHGRLVFLYRMSDLPITQYRTRNYPNPFIQRDPTVKQVRDEPNTPFSPEAWPGSSRHAEWHELRRQIIQRDGYACQQCGSTNQLEVHHTLAKHQGGTDDPRNLITLCENCHITSDRYRAMFSQPSK
jgi:5-methylcytosine-specific restriction endonuclease McrA